MLIVAGSDEVGGVHCCVVELSVYVVLRVIYCGPYEQRTLDSLHTVGIRSVLTITERSETDSSASCHCGIT